MNYTLMILGAPYSSQSASTALQFAKSLLGRGHKIYRIFYYHEGVHNASLLPSPPQNETNIPAEWQKLQKEHNLDLVVCIAAAVKRGVLNENEATRHEKDQFNLSECFELSGLGQLVDATERSDRVITFGP